MKLDLVVSTYEMPGTLAKVLASVGAQSRLPDAVAVADDGSTPETARVIATFAAAAPFPVHHLRQERAGFRKSRILNQAIARLTGDYVVFLDGDSVPHPRFLEDHVAFAERGCWVQGRRAFVKEAHAAAFEPGRALAYALTGKMTGVAKGFRFPVPRVRRNRTMYGILGCNLGIWRDDLDAINGFDEAYEGWGREDSDLGARLYHVGRDRKVVQGRAVIWHLNHPPFPRDGLGSNDALLAEAIRTRRIACERGLSGWKSA